MLSCENHDYNDFGLAFQLTPVANQSQTHPCWLLLYSSGLHYFSGQQQ
uniref:Uncharacterized protein n=1 Tax=Tetranychus urticae TaxID=32264 RepID=T1JUJ9_TETUR